jgi:ABC-type branched-subunit amino acid transport system substrate-binding protein
VPAPSTRATFLSAFTDRHGPPSTLAGSAFDALGMIDAAAEQAPSELDGARLRLRLETTTFAGVVTQYSFTPSRHAGFATEDLVYLRWNAARGLPVRAPDPKSNPDR